MENIGTFQRRGSNWQFVSVNKLEIHLVDFQPLSGTVFLPLPTKLSGKKAIINMKNNDNECFKRCVTGKLNPVEKNAERITKELKEQ